MDMLGGSPQSDCYLTPQVYTVLTHFRSGFRLCTAAIPPQSTGLKADRQKRYFSQGFGVARFGVPISAWPEVSCACLPAGDGGPGIGLARAPKDPVGSRRCGWWSASAK